MQEDAHLSPNRRLGGFKLRYFGTHLAVLTILCGAPIHAQELTSFSNEDIGVSVRYSADYWTELELRSSSEVLALGSVLVEGQDQYWQICFVQSTPYPEGERPVSQAQVRASIQNGGQVGLEERVQQELISGGFEVEDVAAQLPSADEYPTITTGASAFFVDGDNREPVAFATKMLWSTSSLVLVRCETRLEPAGELDVQAGLDEVDTLLSSASISPDKQLPAGQSSSSPNVTAEEDIQGAAHAVGRVIGWALGLWLIFVVFRFLVRLVRGSNK